MAFRTDAPILPLDSLQWDDTLGNGKILLAHFRIGPLDMHLNAHEVEHDADGNQEMHDGDFDALYSLSGAQEPFCTLDIKGRAYIVFAHPYAD